MRLLNKNLFFVLPALIGFSESQAQSKPGVGINTTFMDKTVKPNDDFFRKTR